MRDELLGYLLNALEPAERAGVEEKLAESSELRQELAVLSRALEPLRFGAGYFDPSPGLAERACQFVVRQTTVLTPAGSSRDGGDVRPAEFSPRRSRWSMADLVVAAGILLAGTMVFFPAVNHSRYTAKLAACQNNLRRIGVALAQYSVFHNGFFPNVATEGNLGIAGIYAPKLTESRLLDDHHALICPSSDLAEQASTFRVPTTAELRKARGETLAQMQRSLGGSYGYNLGYVSQGGYHPTQNLQRETFALMADAPGPDVASRLSPNHGGSGQNVLFEDGHVGYMTTCTAKGGLDHIFLNDRGRVAPGLHKDDAVIAPSGTGHISLTVDDEPASATFNSDSR